MNTRIDPHTGESFVPKRRNQKYATTQNRVAYNNNLAYMERSSKSFVDKPLKKNHRILLTLLNPNEIKSYSKDFLKGMGYDFSLSTHYENYKGKICISLYQFILVEFSLQSNDVKIYRSNDFS